MINKFYKNFKVRDYMDEEFLLKNVNEDLIDCSLGTNPFIDEKMIKDMVRKYENETNKYPVIQYQILKERIASIYNIATSKISFGSWYNGNIEKCL